MPTPVESGGIKKPAGGKYGGAGAMGIQAPAEVKYRIIYESVRPDGNVLNTNALCRIAGVSRSGYYALIDAPLSRQRHEEQDAADFALVKQAYAFRGYEKGHTLANTLQSEYLLSLLYFQNNKMQMSKTDISYIILYCVCHNNWILYMILKELFFVKFYRFAHL